MISFKRISLRLYSTNNNIKEAVNASLKPKELKTNMVRKLILKYYRSDSIFNWEVEINFSSLNFSRTAHYLTIYI